MKVEDGEQGLYTDLPRGGGWGWGEGGSRGKEGEGIGMLIAESHHCIAETDSIIKQHTPIKKGYIVCVCTYIHTNIYV